MYIVANREERMSWKNICVAVLSQRKRHDRFLLQFSGKQVAQVALLEAVEMVWIDLGLHQQRLWNTGLLLFSHLSPVLHAFDICLEFY